MKEYKGPRPKPVVKIEVSEKNQKLRMAGAVLFLAIAAVAIGLGIYMLLSTEPGWKEVEAGRDKVTWSQDFVLNYYFGDSGMNSTQEYKRVAEVYNQAMEESYVLFSPDAQSDEVHNLRYLNENVNREVTVAPALYEALSLLNNYNDRSIFLAPVYVEYDRVFSAENDAVAAQYDPMKDTDAMEYVSQVTAFTRDPEMIRLELLGEDRVRLVVAEAYASFAEEYGIEEFLDFGWMTNAFVADYTAQLLIDNGFTRGYLASYDGFTRNLDNGDYTVNVFARQQDGIYMPARLHYSGPATVVTLRDYPMGDRDRWRYYTYADGSITTACLDPVDGRSTSAIHELMSVSKNAGCATVLMEMKAVYFADEFRGSMLEELTEKNISSVWWDNGAVRSSGELRLERTDTP